jgi:hypothetical protein
MEVYNEVGNAIEIMAMNTLTKAFTVVNK